MKKENTTYIGPKSEHTILRMLAYLRNNNLVHPILFSLSQFGPYRTKNKDYVLCRCDLICLPSSVVH